LTQHNECHSAISISPTRYDVPPNAAILLSHSIGDHPQSVHYCNEKTSTLETCSYSRRPF
jgi:hypothetical protein